MSVSVALGSGLGRWQVVVGFPGVVTAVGRGANELNEDARAVLALDPDPARLRGVADLLEGGYLADACRVLKPVLITLGVLGEQVLNQTFDVAGLHGGERAF